jgi:hypothetical protein
MTENAQQQIRMVEVKARAGIACDVCSPTQVFGDEDALQAHLRAFHITKPILSENGEVVGEEESPVRKRRRPGEVIPAATPVE